MCGRRTRSAAWPPCTGISAQCITSVCRAIDSLVHRMTPVFVYGVSTHCGVYKLLVIIAVVWKLSSCGTEYYLVDQRMARLKSGANLCFNRDVFVSFVSVKPFGNGFVFNIPKASSTQSTKDGYDRKN